MLQSLISCGETFPRSDEIRPIMQVMNFHLRFWNRIPWRSLLPARGVTDDVQNIDIGRIADKGERRSDMLDGEGKHAN